MNWVNVVQTTVKQRSALSDRKQLAERSIHPIKTTRTVRYKEFKITICISLGEINTAEGSKKSPHKSNPIRLPFHSPQQTMFALPQTRMVLGLSEAAKTSASFISAFHPFHPSVVQKKKQTAETISKHTYHNHQ